MSFRSGVCRHVDARQLTSQRLYSSLSNSSTVVPATHHTSNLPQYTHNRAVPIQYATPYLTLRFYNEKTTSNPSNDIPIHLVNAKVDLTKTVKHVEQQLHTLKDSKEDIITETPPIEKSKPAEETKVVTSATPENTKSEPVTTVEQTTVQTPKVPDQETLAVVPRPGLGSRSWAAVKAVATHYYDGSKLLVVEIRISARLSKKIFRGDSLSRRERRQVE